MDYASHECEVCRGTDFYTTDGRTYCSRCQCESQAHGHETVVDEDTMGVFQSGLGANLKSVKKRSKKKSSVVLRRHKYLVSFTVSDALTYVIKGWTDDLIELGAPISLKDTVTILWITYLKKLGVSIEDQGEKVDIPNRPTMRDLQVKIFNRRKIINKQQHGQRAKKVYSSDSDSDDIREQRKKRNRRRNKFIQSLVSSHDGSETDQTNVSSTQTSIRSSDDFSLSFVSLNSSNERALSESSASVLDSSDSHNTSDISENENSKEQISQQLQIIERLTFRKKFKKGPKSFSSLNANRAFELFVLAVLATETNTFSIADLVYWAQENGINYKTASQHIPRVMRLHNSNDVVTCIPKKETILTHEKISKNLSNVGIFLELQELIIPATTLDSVFARFLKEFSLPEEFMNIVKKALEHTTWMKQTTFVFKPSVRQNVVFNTDLRVCAMIIFALKYLYGLDDETELYWSANATKHNKENCSKKLFVINDWIQMSRLRAHLIVRHCPDLHERFSLLFPDLILCPEAQGQAIEKKSNVLQQLRQKHIEEKIPSSRDFREHQISRNTKATLIRVGEFAKKICKKMAIQEMDKLDVSKSQTPLFDFTNFFLDQTNQTCCDLDRDEKSSLKQLLEMPSHEIGFLSSQGDGIEVETKGEWFIGQEQKFESRSYRCCYSKQASDLSIKDCNYYRFNPTFWRCPVKLFTTGGQDTWPHFPESFEWILKYFSAYCYSTVPSLYEELAALEHAYIGQGNVKQKPVGVYKKTNSFKLRDNPVEGV